MNIFFNVPNALARYFSSWKLFINESDVCGALDEMCLKKYSHCNYNHKDEWHRAFCVYVDWIVHLIESMRRNANGANGIAKPTDRISNDTINNEIYKSH